MLVLPYIFANGNFKKIPSSSFLKCFHAVDGGGGIFFEWSTFFASIHISFTNTVQKGNLLRIETKKGECFTPENTIQGDNDFITGTCFDSGLILRSGVLSRSNGMQTRYFFMRRNDHFKKKQFYVICCIGTN